MRGQPLTQAGYQADTGDQGVAVTRRAIEQLPREVSDALGRVSSIRARKDGLGNGATP